MEKSNKSNNRQRIPLQRYFPLIYLLVSGIAVSLVMFWLVFRWEQTNQRFEFESWAKAYSNALETTLHDYVGALQFLGDFYDNSPLVTRQQFTNLVQGILPRYPGIQAFGWDPLVKDTERSFYESAAQNEGFVDFEFTERSETDELVRAAQREEYVVVYYIHPLASNRAAFGFDIASNSTRLKAITTAFDTGKLTATARITLVQESGNQYGILLLRPIYNQGVPLNTLEKRRKNRKGLAVEVLRVGQAVEAALQGFSDAGIHLTLYDISADEGNRLLYHRPSLMSEDRDQPIAENITAPALSWSQTFEFAERQWKVVLSPSDFYYQSRQLWESWTVLLGCLLLTTLLAFYMLRKIQYTAEVEQRIKKQAQTNQQLQDEIKERTTAEMERDKTILELQQAINEVKKIRGILPICSSCKKIRDDKGSWNQIERYIRDHSEAEFSHSICPECSKQLYPELHDE